MRDRLILAVTILAVFAGSLLAKGLLGRGRRHAAPGAGQCRRIVSMAPSITETLYALGLGDRVVGVTQYCGYPSEVQRKPKVGGYHNPNFEAVVALKPDLVIMLSGSEHARSAFDKLGLSTLIVCHRNIEGILDSFVQIGRACGAEAKAREIAADRRARLRGVGRKTAGLPRPKVLFVIERTLGSGKLQDVYVAGSDGFFDEIIGRAGGENAYPQGNVRFPVVSVEGILAMNPQVIVDMTAGLAQGEYDRETILADWQQLGQIEAVNTGRVHAIDQDYAFVPGPRFIRLVEDLARLIHPEVDWQ